MCGIAGFIGTGKTSLDLAATIQEMTNSMFHRGPDDTGYAILSYDGNTNKNHIVFGHRRLKIIDLSEKAHQPMFNQERDLVIIYNGEVYNYLELREELRAKGYNFSSKSDTEVILMAYKEWGLDCFKRFNGMWALAIFDKQKRKVILSRDRFGKKPLYYFNTGQEFIFASEIKALLKFPLVVKKPNFERIFRYIAHGYRYGDIDDSSFFEGIRQIPKGHHLEIDEGLQIKQTEYWKLDTDFGRQDISDEEAIKQFRDIFVDAVRLRLRSDVPVGAMLSGGMDSTSVTCVAYKILGSPIITFSGITGQKKGVYDESEFIEEIISSTNANFHYIRPDPADIFDTVEEMLRFHDEPVCTVTWHSLFLIAKKIGQEGIRVILNGHAGDELLAGYWDHYHYNFYDLFEDGNIEGLFYEIESWKRNHSRDPSEISRSIRYISQMQKNRKLELTRFTDYSQLLNSSFRESHKKEIELRFCAKGELQRRLEIELMLDGVPTVLRPEDRNCMSQSIESRSPFLDYRLVEYCFSLPNRFKIRNGLGKWLLRESMKGILPEKVRGRKDKAGFISPADEWFRTINKKQVFELINSESLKNRGFFDIEKINSMFEEHLNKEKNHQMVLWQLINLELWFRRFFGG